MRGQHFDYYEMMKMHAFKKVNVNLAVFSFYIPSLVCFPVAIVYEAFTTSPPHSAIQYLGAFMLTLTITLIVVRLMTEIYDVRHNRYTPPQIKIIIRNVSIVSLVLPAADVLGLISISHSWWAALPITYFIYGTCGVISLYKNDLVPEGFIVKDREQ